MNRRRLSKFTAFVLAASLAAGAFAGCGGKKDVDYSVDNKKAGNAETDDVSALKSALGVPSVADRKFDKGGSSISKIALENAEIEMPEADAVYEMKFNRYQAGNDDDMREKIIKSWLDTDSGIYFQSYSDDTYDEYDKYPLAESFGGTGCYYLGSREGRKAIVESFDTVGSYGMYEIGMNCVYSDKVFTSTSTKPYPVDDDTDEDGNAITVDCGISLSEAVSMANEMLSEVGISGFTNSNAEKAINSYTYNDENGEEISETRYYYTLTYEREIGGSTIGEINTALVEGISQIGEEYTTPRESISFQINSDGILAVGYKLFVDVDTVSTTTAECVNWDDMLNVVDEQIGDYYVKYPVGDSEVVFSRVKLEYYPVRQSLAESRFDEETEDDGNWVYVPVWVFSEYSDGSDEDEEEEYGPGVYSNMVIVNAVTGNIIDMKQGLRIDSGEIFMSLDMGVSR